LSQNKFFFFQKIASRSINLHAVKNHIISITRIHVFILSDEDPLEMAAVIKKLTGNVKGNQKKNKKPQKKIEVVVL